MKANTLPFSSTVTPSLPRLGTRLAKIEGKPMPGPYFSIILPFLSALATNGPYSSLIQKLPSLSREIPSVSRPFTSVPKLFMLKSKATSLVEPVRPDGTGLPVIALPLTFDGIDLMMSARSLAGLTLIMPMLGVKFGVGKNFPDTFLPSFT